MAQPPFRPGGPGGPPPGPPGPPGAPGMGPPGAPGMTAAGPGSMMHPGNVGYFSPRGGSMAMERTESTIGDSKKKKKGKKGKKDDSDDEDEDECKCPPQQQPATQIFICPPNCQPQNMMGGMGAGGMGGMGMGMGGGMGVCGLGGNDMGGSKLNMQATGQPDFIDPAKLCQIQCFGGGKNEDTQTQVICCPPTTCTGCQRKNQRQQKPQKNVCDCCGQECPSRSKKKPQAGTMEGLMPASQQFLMFLQAYGLAAALIKDRNRREEERAQKEFEEKRKGSKSSDRKDSKPGSRKASAKEKGKKDKKKNS